MRPFARMHLQSSAKSLRSPNEMGSTSLPAWRYRRSSRDRVPVQSTHASMNGSSPTSADAELRARYDLLVERSPQGSIFATSWWLDAVAPGGWRMHCAEKGEELVAAWPTV